jgi:FkbM family methyltransferase
MVSDLRTQCINPRTVIDVGANTGQFAVAAAHLFDQPAMYCFEPAPDCVARLKRNLRGLGNVIVSPIALSDYPGESVFHINAHSHSSSMLSLTSGHMEAFPVAVVPGEIRVPVSTLEFELSSVELAPPVLMKIDIQGAEAAMLRGAAATLRRVDYVVVETSFKSMYEGETTFPGLLEIMQHYGFDFVQPIGFLTHLRAGEVLQMDALFIRKSG